MVRSILLALSAAAALSGCGFEPLYGTATGGDSRGIRGFNLQSLDASEAIAPFLEAAFRRRMNPSGASEAAYDLIVRAEERAERLAVQIDASVTRYNYRLIANYSLTERATAKTITGQVETLASFNVVSSQYSTLFAERTAREKAAVSLIEAIERDVLIKLDESRKKS